jgi:hypothetical protein
MDSSTCYPLSGIDWIIHAFDHITRQATGIGNKSQVVLEIDGILPIDELTNHLRAFIKKHPIVHGFSARGLNLKPCWRIPIREYSGSVTCDALHVDGGTEAILSLLSDSLNKPFHSKRVHLAFRIVSNGSKSFLAMTFDHRLFDARGAELFLNLFHDELCTGKLASHDWQDFHLPHRFGLHEKVIALWALGGSLKPLADIGSPIGFPISGIRGNSRFVFKKISFDEQQSFTILSRSCDKAGYLMLMPYLLAVSTHCMHRIFEARDLNKGYYLIPVTIDMRKSKTDRNNIFFNHTSFLLFHIQPNEADSLETLVAVIKRQFYKYIKSEFHQNLCKASYLCQYMPLFMLDKMINMWSRNKIGSFCFSYLGESACSEARFMNCNVRNLFHMPRLPVPPGIGIFFNHFRNRINTFISCLDGILSEEEMTRLTHDLTALLS